MWWMLVALTALMLPVTVARYWVIARRQRAIDQLRLHDPQLASEIEQAAYTHNQAGLPIHPRSYRRPRRPNDF
jgi:hypothetical protein